MKSPRDIKTDKISNFKAHVTDAVTIIVADYKGLTVHEMEDLRDKVREAGGKVSVIKNTLAKVALNELEIDALDNDLSGQVAFVFSKTDAVMGTKAAYDFSKESDSFNLLAGYFDGSRLTDADIKALAMMPSREELQSRFVGILIAPMSDFISTLQAPAREFLGTLEARAKKLGDEAA
jgi:large subunit ribosomal protein L10